MEIKLYITTSEKNKIGKTLTSDRSFNGNLRNETSVINPIIILESDNISTFNYAYIPDFNRYYFITEISSVKNGLWKISLSVDVLESFKDSIKNLSVILKDTEVTGLNKYMTGDVWKVNCKQTTTIKSFPSGLNNEGEFILITAGG